MMFDVLSSLTAAPTAAVVVVRVLLDQPTLLKHPADALDDLLHQCLQLGRAGCGDMPEYGRIGPIGQMHPGRGH